MGNFDEHHWGIFLSPVIAAQHGLQLIKVSSHSRWYWLYGPYMLIEPHTHRIVHSGLNADDVLELLTDSGT